MENLTPQEILDLMSLKLDNELAEFKDKPCNDHLIASIERSVRAMLMSSGCEACDNDIVLEASKSEYRDRVNIDFGNLYTFVTYYCLQRGLIPPSAPSLASAEFWTCPETGTVLSVKDKKAFIMPPMPVEFIDIKFVIKPE